MNSTLADYQIPPPLTGRFMTPSWTSIARFFRVCAISCFLVISGFTLDCHPLLAKPSQVGVTRLSGERQAILLNNGSVIDGRILEDGERVRIAVQYGEILVPRRDIREIAESCQELYARQRDRLPPGEAAAHLELAMWCLAQGLYQEARQELQAARMIQPDHPVIPLAERRLQLAESTKIADARAADGAGTVPGDVGGSAKIPQSQALAEQNSLPQFSMAEATLPLPSWLSETTPPQPPPTMRLRLREDFDPDAVSRTASSTDTLSQAGLSDHRGDPSGLLRGLSPRATSDFVRVIQPIIMNQCATAGCHGANVAEADRLLRIPFGRPATRSETAHNLKVVLAWIDFENPGASPILAVPSRPHGGIGSPIFSGATASQYRQLVDWVYAVAQKEGVAAPQPAPADAAGDLPGGIPPELLEPDAAGQIGGTPDAVVQASAVEEANAALPAVAWECEPGTGLPAAESTSGQFFPELFSENAKDDLTMEFESGKVFRAESSGSPLNPRDGASTAVLGGSTAERTDVARARGLQPQQPESGNSPTMLRRNAASRAGRVPIAGDALGRDRNPGGPVSAEIPDQTPLKVLPFGDSLPPQNHVIYR